MEVVEFNCKKCGADLDKPTDDLGVYVCKYCGFENKIDEDYKINYVATHGEQDIRKKIDEIRTEAKNFLDNKIYKSAYYKYKELLEYTPNDIDAIEGIFTSFTFGFNYDVIDYSYNTFKEVYGKYLDIYKQVQTDNNKVSYYEGIYNNYCKKLRGYFIPSIIVLASLLFCILLMLFILAS